MLKKIQSFMYYLKLQKYKRKHIKINTVLMLLMEFFIL